MAYSIRYVPLTGDDVGRARAPAYRTAFKAATLAYLYNNNTAAAAAAAAFVGRGSGSTCATIWMSVKQTFAAAGAAARRLQLVTRTSNNVLL